MVKTFASTAERDAWIDEHYPKRKALDAPGWCRLPDGGTLHVFCESVTVTPPALVVRQTACRFCELDIEGFSPYPAGAWRDRGSNTTCPHGDNEGKHHAPTDTPAELRAHDREQRDADVPQRVHRSPAASRYTLKQLRREVRAMVPPGCMLRRWWLEVRADSTRIAVELDAHAGAGPRSTVYHLL